MEAPLVMAAAQFGLHKYELDATMRENENEKRVVPG
jgi:hypothetical protein